MYDILIRKFDYSTISKKIASSFLTLISSLLNYIERYVINLKYLHVKQNRIQILRAVFKIGMYKVHMCKNFKHMCKFLRKPAQNIYKIIKVIYVQVEK